MPSYTGTSGADTINRSTATVSWTINGGAGNDTITGGSAADDLYGQDGNDVISGNGGDDFVNGGNGNDSLSGGAGNDNLYGGAGIDTIRGGANDDWLSGDGDTDYLYGDAGKDTVVGGAGSDYLYGGADDDLIYGQAGANNIYGGDGSDTLYGGEDGANRFYFEVPTNPATYNPSNPFIDTIKDFVDGTDKIYIVTDGGLSPTWSVASWDTDKDGLADDSRITITYYPDDTAASAVSIYVDIDNIAFTAITNADVAFA